MSATSAARNPPGDGPRTTSPRLGLIAASAAEIDAVAAHARTSHRLTTTTRSAASSATCVASVRRRGTSRATAAPPGGPAAGTAQNDGYPPAPPAVENGIDRRAVQFVAAPSPGQQADSTLSGQRIPNG